MLLGLSAVNASPALAAVLTAGAPTTAYWIQTGLIAGLLVTLTVLYRASRNA